MQGGDQRNDEIVLAVDDNEGDFQDLDMGGEVKNADDAEEQDIKQGDGDIA